MIAGAWGCTELLSFPCLCWWLLVWCLSAWWLLTWHTTQPPLGTGAAVCVCGEGTGAVVRTRAGEGTDARKNCTWRLFLFFFFFFSIQKLINKKSSMYLLLSHLFYFHFALGRGKCADRRGLLQNMSFSSCLCVRIQFPVLDPRLFSPVRRQLVWQSRARGGSAGSTGGVWSRAGGRRPPWPGGVR